MKIIEGEDITEVEIIYDRQGNPISAINKDTRGVYIADKPTDFTDEQKKSLIVRVLQMIKYEKKTDRLKIYNEMLDTYLDDWPELKDFVQSAIAEMVIDADDV